MSEQANHIVHEAVNDIKNGYASVVAGQVASIWQRIYD